MGTELEFSLLMSKPKLEVIDILKEAAAIPCKNIKFVIFSVLTTAPLLCFLVFFDAFLSKTLVTASNFASHGRFSWTDEEDYYYSYDDGTWSRHVLMTTSLKRLCPQLGLFCLLYLVPYQLVELFTLAVVVDAASDIYGDKSKTISLREMILKPFDKTRLVGTLVTSVYVTLFSTATLIGLLWIVINYFLMSGGFSSYFGGYYLGYRYYGDDGYSVIKIVLVVIHGAAFLALLRKYLEWSAGWNVSLVVSVFGEAYGGEALDGSDYFTRGSRERGLVLMVVFFLWVVGLRVACVCFGCGGLVSFGVMGIVCLGNVMKWVAFVVYFCDCKSRVLEKKVDVEVGSEGNEVAGS